MRATDTLIPSLFAAFGFTAKLDEHRLIAAWPRLVGPQVARHTTPREIRAKTLWVVVDSSTWLHELTLLKPLLLDKIAPHVGKAVVRDLRFVIGEVPEATSTVEPAAHAPARLTPEDEVAVDQVVASIADPDLRESARRLLRRSATSRP